MRKRERDGKLKNPKKPKTREKGGQNRGGGLKNFKKTEPGRKRHGSVSTGMKWEKKNRSPLSGGQEKKNWGVQFRKESVQAPNRGKGRGCGATRNAKAGGDLPENEREPGWGEGAGPEAAAGAQPRGKKTVTVNGLRRHWRGVSEKLQRVWGEELVQWWQRTVKTLDKTGAMARATKRRNARKGGDV